MFPRRQDQQDESLESSSEMAALETARIGGGAGADKAPEKKKSEEEHMSLFWRVFGGTILSIVALVTITLFNNMSNSITELRADISREREARAELVKKDEYNTRVTSLYERMRGIDAAKVEMEGLKEKTSANAAAIDGAKKDTAATLESLKKDAAAAADAMKKDVAALEVVKDRLGMLEVVKKDVAGLDALKEKLASTAADMKALRDEINKIGGEVEKNKSFDLERKTFRDAQAKQIEDSLKELQKGLQDCREKLARLEGAKPTPKPTAEEGK
jgi:DNA repair exonuclease SbcCD ATPase subunit